MTDQLAQAKQNAALHARQAAAFTKRLIRQRLHQKSATARTLGERRTSSCMTRNEIVI
ncbi:MAG: hypothetical protein Q4F13_14125 [Pseudomonadota bacterium]|nr:hypothetical protein [Pseudomonadota bacterium]